MTAAVTTKAKDRQANRLTTDLFAKRRALSPLVRNTLRLSDLSLTLPATKHPAVCSARCRFDWVGTAGSQQLVAATLQTATILSLCQRLKSQCRLIRWKPEGVPPPPFSPSLVEVDPQFTGVVFCCAPRPPWPAWGATCAWALLGSQMTGVRQPGNWSETKADFVALFLNASLSESRNT